MTTHIPTINELLAKPTGELSAIFRQASTVAADATRPAQERDAASRTAETVRRCIGQRPGP